MENGDSSRNLSPGTQKVEPQDHKYDTLTNLEMLDAIDRMVADDDENSMDTDRILAYLDILQERAPVAEDYDSNQAWEVFKQNNASLFEEDPTDEIAGQAKAPAQRKRRFRRLIGVVAAAAALICMVTVVSSASFRAWIREAYEGSFVYRFWNEEDPSATLPDYEITDLPEGYELISSECDDVSGVKFYRLGDSKIGFMYYFANDSSNTKIITHSDTTQLDTSILINGQSADFYISPDGSEANTLLWIDENEKIAFSISSFLDQDTMIKMAESVSKK